MLWYCRFKWHPNTTRQRVAQRIVQLHDAQSYDPKMIKGWYNLAGGGAGFLLVEAEQPEKVTAFLQPYMDLMNFDVHGIYALDYETQIEALRRLAQAPKEFE